VVKERLPGGLSEFVLVPAALVKQGVRLLPDALSFDESTFVEPLACVVRAQRLAEVRPDSTILVMGCGMSGLLHIKLAKQMNCRIVATDVQDGRRRAALEFGADRVIDGADDVAGELLKQNGRKADVIILCTSAVPAFSQAWKCVEKGGAIVFFAVPGPEEEVTVPIHDFWMEEIRMLTSYYCGPADIGAALDLLADGAVTVEDMITHVLPLEETPRAFQLVMEGKDSIKVIIRPNDP
jgi:L-iditol 2-dehydrogenase